MDLFKKLYKLQNKRAYDLIAKAGLVVDKDSKIYYVDSVHGDDSYGGRTMSSPLATIAAAYAKCTSNNHDVIICLPRHDETFTGVLTIAKAGLSILGMKSGNLRPTLDISAAADIFSVEAANVTISGFRFEAAKDAQTADINIAGAFCKVSDCVHVGSTTSINKVNVYTITAAGDDCLLEDITIYNTTVEVVGAILFEGAFTNGTFRNIVVLDSKGFTNGAIYDAAAATGVFLDHCFFQNAKAATAVVNMANNSVGLMNDVGIAGRHTTIASNMDPGTSFDLMNVKVCEEAIKTGMDYDVDAD